MNVASSDLQTNFEDSIKGSIDQGFNRYLVLFQNGRSLLSIQRLETKNICFEYKKISKIAKANRIRGTKTKSNQTSSSIFLNSFSSERIYL